MVPSLEIEDQLINLLELLEVSQKEKNNDNWSLGEYVDQKSDPFEIVSRISRYV